MTAVLPPPPPTTELTAINITGLFKYVIEDKTSAHDRYTQEINLHTAFRGTIPRTLLKNLIDLNIYHNSELLGLGEIRPSKQNVERICQSLASEIKLFIEMQKNTKILDIDMKKLLLDHEQKLFTYMDDFDCSPFITIVQSNVDAADQRNFMTSVGKQFMVHYQAQELHECLGILLAVNTWCQHTAMFIFSTLFNMIYLCFITYDADNGGGDDTQPAPALQNIERYMWMSDWDEDTELISESDLDYIEQKDVIIERYLSTALQQFLLDHTRDAINIRSFRGSQILCNAAKTTDHSLENLERLIFLNIVNNRNIHKTFTYLATKAARRPTFKADILKIYGIWRSLNDQQKLAVYHHCELETNEEKDLVPDILAIASPRYTRTIETIRYTVNNLADRDATIKKFLFHVFSDMDKLFDHILYPDRATVEQVKITPTINCNYFEHGEYSIRRIIDKILATSTEDLKYIAARVSNLLTTAERVSHI